MASRASAGATPFACEPRLWYDPPMDLRTLIPTAYHEAGHAVMTYWLGHEIASEGVWITPDGELIDGSAGRAVSRRPSEAPTRPKERVMMMLAGHLAAHRWMVVTNGERRAREWQENGGPAPFTKDEFLQAYFGACSQVHDGVEVRDDWRLAAMMVGGELDTKYNERSLNRLKARCVRYQGETIKQLENPLVWRSVCKIAERLLSRYRLSDAECKLILAEDFKALESGYHRS